MQAALLSSQILSVNAWQVPFSEGSVFCAGVFDFSELVVYLDESTLNSLTQVVHT